MAKLSPAEIAGYAKAAGFTGKALVDSVAIAMGESGGETTARHYNPNGSTDNGLWQINSIHKGLLKSGDWKNPADNARMAYRIYSDAGKKFTPWVVYNSGKYKMYLPQARKAVGAPADVGETDSGVSGGGSTPGGAAVSGGYQELGEKVSSPSTWWRVGYFIMGSVALFFGITRLAKDTGVKL